MGILFTACVDRAAVLPGDSLGYGDNATSEPVEAAGYIIGKSIFIKGYLGKIRWGPSVSFWRARAAAPVRNPA